jgi:hypothetical protein
MCVKRETLEGGRRRRAMAAHGNGSSGSSSGKSGAGSKSGTGRAGRAGGTGGETGLPASIEAAWGLRERPAKGPKPGLSLDRIVEAAVGVAATEGLAAVSMGRVAKELSVSTMSLYRYVAA